MTVREQASALLTDAVLGELFEFSNDRYRYGSWRQGTFDKARAVLIDTLQPLFDQIERNAEDCVITATKCLDLEGERDDLRAKAESVRQHCICGAALDRGEP
jgi:hypothetical protein